MISSAKRAIGSAVLVITTCVLVQRIIIIKMFASKFADHDQTLVWLATSELKNLRFHEPFFYGQNYNVMIEAVVAVPLLLAGVPHHYALPIATSLLLLLPFILMAYVGLRQQWLLTSLFAPLILLVMPLRFHMITSMPRGFVSGPSLAAVACIIAIAGKTNLRFFWFAFIGMLAVATLPSALLIVFPVMIYLILHYWTNAKLYLWGSVGIILGVAIYGAMQSFYYLNPEYNHFGIKSSELPFSLKTFSENSTNISLYFADILPKYWHWANFLPFIAFISLIILFLITNRSYKNILIISLIVSFIILSLGSGKISDGSGSVFFPFSRFFISITFLLVFIIWLADRYILNWLNNNKRILYSSILLLVIYSLACMYTFFHGIHDTITAEVAVEQTAVDIYPTDYIKHESERLKLISEAFGAELIVGDDRVINYAYPAFYGDHPANILLHLGGEGRDERRTWRITDEIKQVRRRVLLYNRSARALAPDSANIIYAEQSNSSMYVVGNPGLLPSKQFLRLMGYNLSTF